MESPRNIHNVTNVVDGGFLHHRIMRNQPEAFDANVSKYVQNVAKYYKAGSMVVFDGYPDDAARKNAKPAERLPWSHRELEYARFVEKQAVISVIVVGEDIGLLVLFISVALSVSNIYFMKPSEGKTQMSIYYTVRYSSGARFKFSSRRSRFFEFSVFFVFVFGRRDTKKWALFCLLCFQDDLNFGTLSVSVYNLSNLNIR